MTEKELNKICEFIIDNIMRNNAIMFNDECRGDEKAYNQQIDLPAVIASLYNMLHKEVTGKEYDYFFHWVNKIGANVEDYYLKEVIE